MSERRRFRWLVPLLVVFGIDAGTAADLILVASENNPLLVRWNDARAAPVAQWEANGTKGVTILKAIRLAPLNAGASETPLSHSMAELCWRSPGQVMVSLDPVAAREALRDCRLPLVMVGLSQQENNSLKPVRPLAARPIAAICLEADPILNVALIRAFLPKARTIALLRPPTEPAWLPALRNEARRLQFDLREVVVSGDLQGVQALRGLLAGLDAVLLPPDYALINEWSIKPLLLMTIRQQIPVFGGLTERYIEAGVVAGVIADQGRLLEQMRDVASFNQTPTSTCRYPTAVRVAINTAVARTLGFSAAALETARSLYSRP